MNSNLFWCIIGIVGGAIFSLIISFIFYFIGLKRKRINYYIQTICLVSPRTNKIAELEVKYKSKYIEDLYTSTITIKNIGNSIIEKHDVSPSCPFSISTNGIFLLDNLKNTDLYSSNKTNHSHVFFDINSANDTCRNIIFNFEYIDKEEEWTYTVLHTGNISFNGILKEGKITNNTETEKRKNNLFQLIIKYILEFK